MRQGPVLAAFFVSSVVAGASMAAPQAPVRSEVAPDTPTPLTLAKGSTLDVKGVYGEIVVVKAAGAETRVAIARDAGPDAPRLEMLSHDAGVTFCAVYPSKNPKKPNECVPGAKGRLTEGTRKDSPATRFRVELAEGVNLLGRMAIGDLKVEGVTGNLDVATLNGNIFIVDAGSPVLQGAVGAKGDLDAVISSLKQPEQRRARLEVAMGELRVTPPSALRVSYYVASDREIRNEFTKEKLGTGPQTGRWGGDGPAEMNLSLTTGAMFGTLRLRAPR